MAQDRFDPELADIEFEDYKNKSSIIAIPELFTEHTPKDNDEDNGVELEESSFNGTGIEAQTARLEGSESGSSSSYSSVSFEGTGNKGTSEQEKRSRDRARSAAAMQIQLSIILNDIAILEDLLEEYKDQMSDLGQEIFALDKTMDLNQESMDYWESRDGMSMSEIAAYEFRDQPPEAIMAALNNPITHDGHFINFSNEGLYYITKDENGKIVNDPDTGLPLREYITDTKLASELMAQATPRNGEPPKLFANLTAKGDPTNPHIHEWIGVDIKVPAEFQEQYAASVQNIDPALTIEPITANDAYKVCNSAQECMQIERHELRDKFEKAKQDVKETEAQLDEKYEEKDNLEDSLENAETTQDTASDQTDHHTMEMDVNESTRGNVLNMLANLCSGTSSVHLSTMDAVLTGMLANGEISSEMYDSLRMDIQNGVMQQEFGLDVAVFVNNQLQILTNGTTIPAPDLNLPVVASKQLSAAEQYEPSENNLSRDFVIAAAEPQTTGPAPGLDMKLENAMGVST